MSGELKGDADDHAKFMPRMGDRKNPKKLSDGDLARRSLNTVRMTLV